MAACNFVASRGSASHTALLGRLSLSLLVVFTVAACNFVASRGSASHTALYVDVSSTTPGSIAFCANIMMSALPQPAASCVVISDWRHRAGRSSTWNTFGVTAFHCTTAREASRFGTRLMQQPEPPTGVFRVIDFRRCMKRQTRRPTEA